MIIYFVDWNADNAEHGCFILKNCVCKSMQTSISYKVSEEFNNRYLHLMLITHTLCASCWWNLFAEKKVSPSWIWQAITLWRTANSFRLSRYHCLRSRPVEMAKWKVWNKFLNTLSIATITSKVFETKSCLKVSMFSFHLLHPPSFKHKAW